MSAIGDPGIIPEEQNHILANARIKAGACQRSEILAPFLKNKLHSGQRLEKSRCMAAIGDPGIIPEEQTTFWPTPGEKPVEKK